MIRNHRFLKNLWETFPDHQEIALRYARGMFGLTLVQDKEEIHATVAELVALLRDHPAIIPEFREPLDQHLSQNPERRELYRPLLELFDGAVAVG